MFTYNDLNQLTTVSIEGIDLVINEYDVYGKLLSVTYANSFEELYTYSFEESYTYDNLDRVKVISYNGIVNYSISSNGMIYYDYEISWKVTGKMLAALGAIVLIATGFGAAAGESVLQGVSVW